jgi:hypothetical protein
LNRAAEAERDLEATRNRLAASESIGEEERQALVSHSLAEVQQLEARSRREKQIAENVLERERRSHVAEAQEMAAEARRRICEAAASAASETEARVRGELTEALDAERKEAEERLSEAELQRASLADRLADAEDSAEELRAELNAYRVQKTAEVAALERRLRFLIRNGTNVSRDDDNEVTRVEARDATSPGGLIQIPEPARRGDAESCDDDDDDDADDSSDAGILNTLREETERCVAMGGSAWRKKSGGAAVLVQVGPTHCLGFRVSSLGFRVSPSFFFEALHLDRPHQCRINTSFVGAPFVFYFFQLGGAQGAPAAAASAVNALRERELQEAFERELELERLQQQAASEKLQEVIQGLHKVGGGCLLGEREWSTNKTRKTPGF